MAILRTKRRPEEEGRMVLQTQPHHQRHLELVEEGIHRTHMGQLG